MNTESLNQVDIVITTKNRVNELLFTISHLLKIGFKQQQLYIVDDASTDDTVKILTKKYPDINLKINISSEGYIRNRNYLMGATEKPFLLSLDDDSHIRCAEDIVDALQILADDSSIGIFTFKAYEQIELPPSKEELPNTVRQVRTYIGCGHIIKREAIDLLNEYKEEFEFYCEELDFSIRAWQSGYKTVTKDNLVVHHRVDWKLRATQKKTEDQRGIYGAIWRSKLGFSNNLLIAAMYYPIGYDILFILTYIAKRFYFFAIKKGDYEGFFQGLKRYIKLVSTFKKNSKKMAPSLFKKWISLPVY